MKYIYLYSVYSLFKNFRYIIRNETYIQIIGTSLHSMNMYLKIAKIMCSLGSESLFVGYASWSCKLFSSSTFHHIKQSSKYFSVMVHDIVDIYLFMEFQVIFLIVQLQKLQQSWEMLVLYPWKVGKKILACQGFNTSKLPVYKSNQMAEASKVSLVVIKRTCKFWGDLDVEKYYELITHFKYGRVMFFIREGFFKTNSFHSS